MKNKSPFKVNTDYFLRTPILSISRYRAFINGNFIPVKNIEDLFNDTLFKEAIYLASPELYSESTKLINGELTNPKKIKNIHLSLLKYATRMSTRCTPFGLFSGCSKGAFGIDATIELNKKNTL
jgi:lantibiotic biosynthesis protein|tara:strand:+ start:5871 stop:6242 length:372 start_codon:yes stop_codon:yes gene_type:complete